MYEYARYDVPQSIPQWIREITSRFGMLRLIPGPQKQTETKDKDGNPIIEKYLYLTAKSAPVFKEIGVNPAVKKYLCASTYVEPQNDKQQLLSPLTDDEKNFCFLLHLTDRGTIKQLLLQSGWPVKDEVVLQDGEPLEIALRETTLAGKPLQIREYQKASARALVGDKGPGTGFGTIVDRKSVV